MLGTKPLIAIIGNCESVPLSIGVPLVVGFVTGWLRYRVVALNGSIYVVNVANVDARPNVSTAPDLSEGWQRIRSNQTAGLRFAMCYDIVATIALGDSFLSQVSSTSVVRRMNRRFCLSNLIKMLA
ncbi:hypothetical protein IQ250_27330 [Pseudanabaenaceae cyanobacterium LEGE 13415]|nr:hypothetical protein [Pseudanabaenaceae cyanobacterium LEGE 13415]